MEKKKKGFALMSLEKRREIAGKGGKEAQRLGTAHRFSSKEARAAGKKSNLTRKKKIV